MAQLLQLNTGTLQNSQLSALQKVDPAIVAILTGSPHVAVYIFPQGAKQWERKNIEGPLYLVRRSTLPQFSFIILNRKENSHMVEMIDLNFEFQNQEPYIIFRNSKAPVPMPHGMWFKSTEDRERVWQHFQTIKDTLKRRARGGDGGGDSGSGGNVRQGQRPGGGGNQAVAPVTNQMQQMRVEDPAGGLTADQVELSKSQLQKILIGMMSNDKFVDQLHSLYVSALRKRRATKQGGQ